MFADVAYLKYRKRNFTSHIKCGNQLYPLLFLRMVISGTRFRHL